MTQPNLLLQFLLLPLYFTCGRCRARISLVVPPFALVLPAGWEIVAVVIVFQSLVELFGMVFYLWWMPRLFRR